MVRRFRHEKDLRQEPYSLCFKLRDQRNPEKPLQHNVLLGYERPPYSRAMYVCPTILSETEYTAQLHNDVAIRFWDKLFYYRDFQILTEPGWASSIVGSVPFLRAHMSIIPHRPVESSDHYYSFSKYANDLAFHSPEILPDTGGRLGDFISSEILKFDRGEKRFLRPYELSMEIYKSTPDHIKYSLGEPTDNNASEWISKHGKILREEYEISQLILVASKMQL